MGKPRFESWGTEVGLTLHALQYAIRHIKEWMEAKKVPTPLFHFRASGYILPRPFGIALVIAPWNYPLLLSMRPVIGALAAGNTVILKPSEFAVYTTALLTEKINAAFPYHYLHVVPADAQGSKALVEEKTDYIFFTGSTRTGRLVYEAAAKQLIPCTLELGGKSPCIVDKNIPLHIAAKRITWAKFMNCGQTCASPDYVLVHESICERFLSEVAHLIRKWYGEDPSRSPNYGRMINTAHFDRIIRLIGDADLRIGGDHDRAQKYIGPVLLALKDTSHPLMQEEIFGPVMPVIAFRNVEDVVRIVNENPDPLSLNIFSRDRKFIRRITHSVRAGDICINELMFHIGQEHLPFGGIGNSGMGKYGGEHTFHTFSHMSAVLDKKFFPDFAIRYPPYGKRKFRLLRRIMRRTLF